MCTCIYLFIIFLVSLSDIKDQRSVISSLLYLNLLLNPYATCLTYKHTLFNIKHAVLYYSYLSLRCFFSQKAYQKPNGAQYWLQNYQLHTEMFGVSFAFPALCVCWCGCLSLFVIRKAELKGQANQAYRTTRPSCANSASRARSFYCVIFILMLLRRK